MTRSKAKYGEGDAFAVPLDDGSHAAALVARRGRGLLALGYFFGPRRTSLPTLAELTTLGPSDAVLVCRFSALAIKEGSWPRVGHLSPWDRDRWPVPGFRSGSTLVTGEAARADYDDALNLVGERLVSREEFASLADSGTYGSRAVELELSQGLPGRRVGLKSGSRAHSRAVSPASESVEAERPGLLDNDDAMDWLGSLVRSRSAAPVEKALDRVIRSRGYVELPAANVALAAAEVAAAAAAFPAADLPASVSAWVAKHPDVATAEVLEKARRVMERVTGPDSELREVWAESPSQAHWRNAVGDLASRVDAALRKRER
jgi:hypothetical protein